MDHCAESNNDISLNSIGDDHSVQQLATKLFPHPPLFCSAPTPVEFLAHTWYPGTQLQNHSLQNFSISGISTNQTPFSMISPQQRNTSASTALHQPNSHTNNIDDNKNMHVVNSILVDRPATSIDNEGEISSGVAVAPSPHHAPLTTPQQQQPELLGYPLLPAAYNAFPSLNEAQFINKKQLRRILIRRKAREKSKEIWKLQQPVAAATPCEKVQQNHDSEGSNSTNTAANNTNKRAYVHESRHKHAMKRPRGPKGRFLTKEELVDYYKDRPEDDPI